MKDVKAEWMEHRTVARDYDLRRIQDDFAKRRHLLSIEHGNEQFKLNEEELEAITDVLAKFEKEKIVAEARAIRASSYVVTDLAKSAAKSKDAPQ